MAEKPDLDKADKTSSYVMLGAIALLMAIGAVLTVGGVWMLLGFDSCAQTFLCDDDIVPPAITIGVGLSTISAATTGWRAGRRYMTGGSKEIRNPRLVAGVILTVIGFGLLGLDVHQQLMNANTELSYYTREQYDTTKFVVSLLADCLMLGAGVTLLRTYRRLGYPYI